MVLDFCYFTSNRKKNKIQITKFKSQISNKIQNINDQNNEFETLGIVIYLLFA